MKSRPKTFSKLLLIGLVLAILTTFAYWPVKDCEFVSIDDGLYVTENPHVQQGLNLEGVKWALTTFDLQFWQPLTWLSHMLDWQLYGANASGHHITNLIFHLLSSVLLFLWLNRATQAPRRSAFVAALFALHPLRVESVAWVAERKDVLSTFFWMLTLHAYTSYVESLSRDARIWIGKYFLALMTFALGLMAKPMLVTMPFVFWLLDFWPLRRFSFTGNATKSKSGLRRIILEKVPFLFLSAAASMLTLWSRRRAGGVATAIEPSVLWDRIANALVTYLRYVAKMIWPTNLAVGYPIETPPMWEILVAVTFFIFVTALVIRWKTSRPYFVVGWFWYLGTLIPVIGLVHIGAQTMADRFTYVPLIGIFIAIAWGAVELFRSSPARRMMGVAGILIVGGCVGLTRGQVAHWKNSETLAEQGLRSTQHNYLMLTLLGVVRDEQGRFGEAIPLLSDSVAINPNSVIAWSTLGSAFQKAGKDEQAMAAFEKALALEPNNANTLNNLGFFLLEQGKANDAIPRLTMALQSRPEFPEAHYNLGNALFQKREITNAILHYEKAVQLRPEYAVAQANLATALIQNGKFEEARVHVEKALQLKPNNGLAHHNLSEILFHSGKFTEAEVESRRAVELDSQPMIQYQLALTLDAQKKWAEAEPLFLKVLEVANRAGDRRLANEITQRLASYRESR